MRFSNIIITPEYKLFRKKLEFIRLEWPFFDNISRDPDSVLQLDKTLEDYEYESGRKTNPAQLSLYYDYLVDFKDCHLLLCDH